MLKFALAGNPNCGKTTLFNALTGATAHVGNWPGVTVDKREGIYKKGAEPVSVVDLPGIYSLSPYTPEEVISRNFILEEKPDCVIDLVDATNLERNLYLTTQLLEIDVPVVIALNMTDVVEKNGDKLDSNSLEKELGVPVVAISALKGKGIDQLMKRCQEAARQSRRGTTVLKDSALAHLIGDVKIALEGQGVKSPLFHAVKLVEGDELETKAHPSALEMVKAFQKTFSDDTFGEDFEALVADARYAYISKHASPAFTPKASRKALSKSDRADRILTNRWAGIPIFLVILFAVFHLTFSENFLFLGGLISDDWVSFEGTVFEGVLGAGALYAPGVILNALWNDVIVGNLAGWIQGLVEGSGAADWCVGLINHGVIDGLTAVLSFLPQILVLFLFFSILEDSGYMARVAFLLDRIFRKFGLSGRAFMPMIMGFGCSIPAMINTRTLADEKERTATVRVIPFFSCGAKLPILTAIAGGIVQQFKMGNADLITYAMYLIGIVTAIVTVVLMRNTTMRGEVPPFILELPAYHVPQLRNLMLHLWDKCKHFIKKAFTLILASTIVIWAVSHFTFDWQFLSDEQMDQSILAQIGKLVQPVFTPLGFGAQLGGWGWVFGVAAVTGLIAKENVIATFGTLAACIVGAALAEDESGVSYVVAMIQETGITVPALIAFIAFNMTTIPCFAAVATAKAELSTKKSFHWTLVFWVAVSYVVACMVYTVGSWWWTCFVWLGLWIATGILIWISGRRKR